MKIETMDIKDFGPRSQKGNISKEHLAMAAMESNTAMMLLETSLKCGKTKSGALSCTVMTIKSTLNKQYPDRIWSVRHVPAGHAVACFPK